MAGLPKRIPGGKATRTYTGAALKRRQAFGDEWGKFNSQAAQQLRKKGR
jgi:hypothetical protein